MKNHDIRIIFCSIFRFGRRTIVGEELYHKERRRDRIDDGRVLPSGLCAPLLAILLSTGILKFLFCYQPQLVYVLVGLFRVIIVILLILTT